MIKEVQGSLVLRPYQVMCLICSIGEGKDEPEVEKLREAFRAIRQDPDLPLTLRCNVGDVFAYQDPGPEDDCHGNAEFNRKRDLEILQRLDLPPGITLPARIILHRLWDRIESPLGICGYNEDAPEGWKGCPKAKSGFYEKGREICLSFAVPNCASQLDFSEADLPKAKNALIVPRTKEEREEAKKQSLEAMYQAEAIAVRPHILLCAVCQYGAGAEPGGPQDNLPEMLRFILKKPEAKIKLAEGADWMMCAPCPSWTKRNCCVQVKGYGGLTNQLRDVRVLQKLGLRYGDVMNARELYRLIFERIPSTALVCRVSEGVSEPSVWLDGCGQRVESNPNYDKGREKLMKEFGF
jgi:hypothetical protein